MADVFLSYARVDRALAEQVKAGLEAAGLSVFFDVEGLDGGDVFPDVLDREVKGAGAVVSLWSQHSLSRPWVKQECSIGLKRKCLIPLAIERLGELDVPVAFEGLQQIDFTGFHGRTDGAEWQKLMRALARTLKRPELAQAVVTAARAPVAAQAARGPWAGWPKLVAGMAGVAAVIAAVGFGYRMLAPKEAAAPAVEVAESVPAAGDANVTAEPPEAPIDGVESYDWVEVVYPMDPSTGRMTPKFNPPDAICGDFTATVFFDPDKAGVPPEGAAVLDAALKHTRSCLFHRVQIQAYDTVGLQTLTNQRARSVGDHLRAQNVTVEEIREIGSSVPSEIQYGARTPYNHRAIVYFQGGQINPERNMYPSERQMTE